MTIWEDCGSLVPLEGFVNRVVSLSVRLAAAIVAGYTLGFLVELALGGSDVASVGWRDPWLPLAVEGAVVGAVVGGWLGGLLAPLPFLLTPETLRWVRDAVVDLQRGERFIGLAAMVYVVPLVLATWVGGAVGSVAAWFLWGRKRGRS